MNLKEIGSGAVAWLTGRGHTRYEDRHALFVEELPVVDANPEKGQILAVFDGMGGRKFGCESAIHMADALSVYYVV